MDYIITKDVSFFKSVGNYNYCSLDDMELPDTIAIDTETTGLDPIDNDIFCVQIGTGTNNYLIDMQTFTNGYSFKELEPYIKDKVLVGHNITFDLCFFYKHGFYPNSVHDTFIASKLIYNGYPSMFRHGLGFVLEREIGVENDKSAQKYISTIQLRTDKNIRYSFNDVDELLRLHNTLQAKIDLFEMKGTYELHRQYIRALAYMEICGMPFSEERWIEKIEADVVKLELIKQEVVDYIWEYLPQYRAQQTDLFNTKNIITPDLSSPLQMFEVFEDFGINIIDTNAKLSKKEKAKGITEKKSIRETVIKKSSHKFVDIWLKYKGFQHSVNNFGYNILSKKKKNDRIYTSFNPILDTARISTRKGGINFLNFPANEKTRRTIKAQEGYKMIVCDYDGQENVTGADMHQDPVMVQTVNEGLDLHCAFARMIFPELADLSDDEIKKHHKEKREYSKPPRFAFAYGGTGYTVAINLNLPLEEGYRLEELFKDLHSKIYEWGAKGLDKALSQGYIRSAGGFRLHLDRYDEYLVKSAEVAKLSKKFWDQYSKGKKEYTRRKIALRSKKEYAHPVSDQEALYEKWKEKVSWVTAMKSSYGRLCLNNPIQTTSAHQTKMAIVLLFDTIVKENHIGRVKICNAPHDEVVLEVENELVENYRDTLETCMRIGGDSYLTSGLVKMGATANIGEDWYEAK